MDNKQIHLVMAGKGFWTRPMDSRQGRTWAQLCQVLIEWNRYLDANGREGALDAAADVWIVTADLLAQFGFSFTWGEVLCQQTVDAIGAIADTMETYRKFDVMPSVRLVQVLGYLKFVEVGLEEAIERRLEWNRSRPFLYGVKWKRD